MIPSLFPVACHTDNVGPGSTFVAIQGTTHDGAQFIPQAIQKGAITIVIHDGVILEPSTQQLIEHAGCTLIRVENTRLALAQLSAQALGNPAQKLCIIGITGTKGKTTTAFLVHHLLAAAGYKTALLSTVQNSIGATTVKASLTTAQPDYLHAFLQACVQQGITHVVMEVAAQAVSLHRTAGICFDGIIFTNFSLEHLEFYPSLDDYFAAKVALLTQLKHNAPCLINSDDAWCKLLLGNKQYTSFGLHEPATYRIAPGATVYNGIHAQCKTPESTFNLHCPSLIGQYNLYNVLSAVALAHALGVPTNTIHGALRSFGTIPGRLEQHKAPNGATFIIDYAHNPDSYTNVLSTLRQLTKQLIVVFGAGGERDPSQRPLMGSIAAAIADVVIITSDNPRSEDPQQIAHDIKAGVSPEHMHKISVELDRHKAIEQAYEFSQPDSLVAVLGKGPDEYQIVGKTKTYFSEKAIIQSLR